MAVNRICHVTIAPFVFAGSWSPESVSWKQFCTELRDSVQGTEVNLTAIESALLGPPQPAKFVVHCGQVDLVFFFFPAGAGACRIVWPPIPSEDCERVDDILMLRRNRHSKLLNGTESAGASIHSAVRQARKLARHPSLTLPATVLGYQPLSSYVFSMFVVVCDRLPEPPEAELLLQALLEPSRKGIADADWEEAMSLANPGAVGIESRKDWDLRVTSRCHLSWASLVGVCKSGVDDLIELYSSLEVRLQTAWCLAHTIGSVPVHPKPLSVFEVGVVSATLESGIRQLADLRNPTASERVTKLYEGMEITSGLKVCISGAREHIEMLRAFSAAKAMRTRGRFELVAEVFLFVLVVLQLIPLIFETPLTGVVRNVLGGSLIVGSLAYVVVRWLLRDR